jgi:hypothetical protein
MERLSFSVLFVVAVVASHFLSCGTEDEKRNDGSENDSDSGADSDADADGDTDTDTDADTGTEIDTGTGTDTGQEPYLSWEEIDIGQEVPGLCGDYVYIRIAALAENDVVLCLGENTWGTGLAEFDGFSLIQVDYPGEIEQFLCTDVWHEDGDVWAWGYSANSDDRPHVLHRVGESWVEESVEGFELCGAVDADACSIQAMYTDGAGTPRAVGYQADWSPPVMGERMVWMRDEVSGHWSLDGDAVFPGFDVIRWGGPWELLLVVGGDDAAWAGKGESEWKVLEVVGGQMNDLGYPLSETQPIRWMGLSTAGELFAVGSTKLLSYIDGAWNSETETICEDDYERCWNAGAFAPGGDLYLGGGYAFGDVGSTQWRLHRWDGENLTGVLEPCPGEEPYCGISDLDVAEERLFAAGKRNGDCLLIWTDLPLDEAN